MYIHDMGLATTQKATGRAYRIPLPGFGICCVQFCWPTSIGDRLSLSIIALMRATTKSTPIIGFGTDIGDEQAQNYIVDLRATLESGKCCLLTVFVDGDTLIGLCTVRRNLNPNNRHIADLGKGMVDERYRAGGLVLATAFLEIAERCESDGVELLTLDVRAGTRAHKVWEHYGFETYGVLDDYARSNGRSFQGYFMKQQISALRTLVGRHVARAGVSAEVNAVAA